MPFVTPGEAATVRHLKRLAAELDRLRLTSAREESTRLVAGLLGR